MPSHPNPGSRLRRAALAALLLSATPALHAQAPAGAVVQYLPQPNDPGERLAAALRTLATNPNDVSALVAAGQNAVVLGDPNAAVGFFGRAGSLAPRDGRVKAGLGSALVQLEKPQDALRLFAEAASLGVPEADFAADRGLAYDLTGDTKRAQRDYQTVLAAHPDDDATRRRLALSQGIAGDRKTAIATLDPLIRKRDIAAWRAQTFVLAMTGDAAGANDITRIMLPQQQAALQPFLQRLATLAPADKARAVHFGEMPSAGRRYSETQLAAIGAPATYAAPRPQPSPAAVTPQPRPAPVVSQPAPAPAPAVVASSDLAPATGALAPTPGVAPATGYAAAPLAGIALSTAPQTTPATAVASPPVTAPPPSVVATTDIPASTPAPSVAAGMPIGSTGSEHFDLPHDSTVRHAVPRTQQATARPVPTPVPTPTPAPATVTPAPATVTPAPVRVADAPPKPVVESPAPSPAPVVATPTSAPVRTVEATPKPVIEKVAPPPVRPKPVVRPTDDATTTVAETKPAKKTAKADDEPKAKTVKGKAADEDATTARSKTDAKGKTRTAKTSDEDDTKASAKKGGHTRTADAADEKPAKGKSTSSKTKGHADESDEDTGTKKGKGAKKGEKAEPARVYVQVAGGANRDDMDKAWAGVRKKAPDLMKGHTASTTPVHATNRLLVGPFKDEAEAQAFVNKAAGKGVSGFVVKTDKGQKIDKVDSPK